MIDAMLNGYFSLTVDIAVEMDGGQINFVRNISLAIFTFTISKDFQWKRKLL